MTTAVWAVIIAAAFIGGYTSHKVTKWYYKRQIKKITK